MLVILSVVAFAAAALMYTPTAGAAQIEVCAPAWDAAKNYPGDPVATVSHPKDGTDYNWTNNWWANPGDEPGTSDTWTQGAACIQPTPLPPPPVQPGAHIYYFPEWGVYGRNFQVGDIQPLVQEGWVDTIQYAFIDVNETGACEIDDPNVALNWATGTNGYEQTGTLAQMAALRDDYVGYLKIVLSLGGWTLSDHFSPIAADPAKRATLVSSCIALMQEHGFDGIDVDWEFPGGGGRFDNNHAPDHENVDGPNFALLLQELRAGLNEAGTDSNGDPYLLTIAVNAGEDKIERLQPENIHPHVDYIQLMTYDLNGGWSNMPAHNAPLYANPNDPRVINGEPYTQNYNSASAVDQFLAAGVPAEKLVFGLAFYGRAWVDVPADSGFDPAQPGLFGYGDNGTLVETSGYWCSCEPDYDKVREPMHNDDGGGLNSNNGNQSPGPSADGLGGGSWDEAVFDYDDVQYVLLDNGWTRYYDEYAQSPYAYNPDYPPEFPGSWVSYDDVESIAAKTIFAANHCLGGVMIWELTGNDINYNPWGDLYRAIWDGNNNMGALGLDSDSPDCPDRVVFPGADGTVDGVATRQGASDHSGIVVSAWDGATEVGNTTTDAGGNYSLALPAGTYTIKVEGALALDAEKADVAITADTTTTLSAVVLLAGDLDDNDTINIYDLSIMGAQYGKASGDAGWDARADLNQSGAVDIYDLSIIGSNYGKSSPVSWP